MLTKNKQSKISIGIVDDHPMVLIGLRNMLSDARHIRITDCYQDGEELLLGLEKEVPDVLLLDIQLPGKTGDQLAPVLLKRYPRMRIMALSNFDSALYIKTMLRLGVLGYLLKTTRKDTLIQAIETVYRGDVFIEPHLSDKVEADAPKVDKQIYAQLALTMREKEILQLFIEGCNNRDISEKLHISYNTIRNYRVRIFNKMDVTSMGELVRKALTSGMM